MFNLNLILAILLIPSYIQAYKYNVLMIVLDDLRPALGIYNDQNAYTPNIDKLAQKSVVFKRAFAQQALCAPSRNSFLTSRRPDTLHLYDFYNYWRETVGDFTTLPQHFKNNGYLTHSVGKIFHPGVSSNYTDDYPQSWSLKPFHPSTQRYKNAKVCVDESGVYGINIVCPVRLPDVSGGTLPDIETFSAASKFLKHIHNSTKPFFLAVGFHKPHIPLKYPRKYLDYHPLEKIQLPHFMDRPSSMPNVAWNPWNDMRLRDDILKFNLDYPFGRIPDNYTRKIVQSYSAAVTYVDDLIGNLLNNVNLDNTVVVIVGDHGVSIGEHGEYSKYSNFDIATRVPLMFYIPNFTEKSVMFEEVVELVDIFPTLVDLTQVSESIQPCHKSSYFERVCTEGISLLQDIIDLKHNDTKAFKDSDYCAISQYPRPGLFPTAKPDSDKPKLKEIKIMGYSIRTILYRYTEWVAFDPKTYSADWTQVFAKELYNHEIDPNENMNLAELIQMEDIMKYLHDKLLERLNVVNK